AYRAAPEVVGKAEGELRQQITEQRIGNRLSRPARTPRLLGLLEVIAHRGGVDAQHPKLAGFGIRGVARRPLGLRLEGLGEAEAHGLGGVTSQLEQLAGKQGSL